MVTRLFRVARIMLSAGLLVTCSDSLTSPTRPGFGSLAVTPVFSSVQSLAGLNLDHVRLQVVRPPGQTLLDRTFSFPPNQPQLAISEPVLLSGASERLQITLTYLSGTSPLFRGSTLAEVHQGPPDTASPVDIPVEYVGVGGQITAITLLPQDTVLTFGATLHLRVTAVDAQEQDVPEFYVSWQSDDPTQVPDGAGTLVAGNTRTVLHITATSPPSGAADATTVTIVPPAAEIVKTAGDAQTGPVGTLLLEPLEVEVRGSDHLPVPGVSVTFATPDGGTVDSAVATTDANGRARTGATLGPVEGDQSFIATVAGVGSVSFTATAGSPVLPSVSLAAAAQTVSEGVGTATITAQLSNPSTQAVTVPFTVGGTAIDPDDYTIGASPLTIPAGSTTGAITVTVVADGVAEADESVIVTLGTPTNATLGATPIHTLTITGQTSTVSLTAAAQTVSEGVGTATITAQLSSPSTQAVTVPFTLGGTAIDPDDYTISATPITIPAGSTTGTITVTVVDDAVAESDETVLVTLGTPTNAALGATVVHTLTITGQTPTVSFTAATQTVNEGVGTATITAQLSSPSTQAVTVPFTVGGSAINPADYTISASPLTIPAGSTSGTATVTVVADGEAEPDETVIVTLGTATNATLASPSVHTLTIAEQLPTVSFTSATQTLSEGTVATITAQLSGPSTQPVTVPFTAGGTATNPDDYTVSASPLIIPVGSTSGTVTVTIVADGVAEPDESVILTLGTPTNATLGATAIHTVNIAGVQPAVSFTAATQAIGEGEGAATITAQLSSPSTQAVTVPFTVGGTAIDPDDYTISASPITIPAGSTTGTVTVTVAADAVAEPDETVIVTLGTPTNAALGATPVHTLTIGAQLPTVSFAADAQTVSEGGGTATITAQLSGPSTQVVTVPFTLGGTALDPDDYTISPTPITIPAGSTTGTVTVTLVADAVAEPNETVVVTLGTPSNATLASPSVHTLTIGAQVPTVNFTAARQTVAEGAVATITIELSSPSSQVVTLPFTLGGGAVNPADYTISASPLTIPAGSTTGAVTVTVVDDGLAEPNQTVIVRLGTPTNATLGATHVHTLTITGQTPTVSLTAATQTVSEGTVATITAQLSGPSTQVVTVPYTLAGTAVDPDDYTISASPLTIPAGSTSGTVTITLVADAVAEPDETVIVTLGKPSNATLASPSAHTLTIAEQVPTVSLTAASQTVSEGTVATITAQLSSPSTQAVTVPFTVDGTAIDPDDYTISASPLTIPAGSTSGTVTVTVVADGVAEPDESVIVTLGTPTNASLGATAVHTVNIGGVQPAVSFTADAQTVSEGVGTATITAQLSSPSSQVVTVPFTVTGSATDPDDYTISASPLTIPVGSTTGTVTISLVADGVAEPDETVIVTLGTPTNAALGATPVHTLTIAAVVPTVSLTAATQTVSEGTVATITAQLSEPSTQLVTVPYTVGGSAIDPADYTISASPLTIPAGSTTGTVTVTVEVDGVAEPDESVIVTLGTPTNATLASPSAHTLTIAGQTPTVSFTALTQAVSEGSVATITAQLSGPSTQVVTVPFTLSGSAVDPDDYTISASPMTIPAGSTSGTVTVTVVADGVAEPNETVVVTMGDPSNATLGATPVHALTIGAQLPTVRFSAPAQTVSEGVGTATITAQLSIPSTQDVTIPYAVDGTASDPEDFTISASPLTIPAGSTTGTVTVTIVADGVAEPDETVIVTMGVPGNATLASPSAHTLTIASQTPTVSFTTATQTVIEGTVATITAQLSSPSTQAVTVPFTVSGSATDPDDYTISATPITIPPGSTSGTVTVTVVADGVAEPDETVSVTMGTPSNATLASPSAHTLTITGQVPTVSFTAATQTVNEGVGTATITAQLSEPSTQTVTVPYTVGGTALDPDDYTISASPLTIPAGSISGTVTVAVVADGVAEPNETVVVTLGAPTNATLGAAPVHTLTIGAQVPTVSFSTAAQAVTEGTVATITAQLSEPSTQVVSVPFTVGGTAIDPDDYTISATPVTIPAGSTSASVTITVVADGVAEPNETVIVTLGSPSNATLASPAIHTLTIAGQTPTVSLTAATQTVTESAGTATITAQLSEPSTQTVTVPYTLGGTAIDPDDYTISASPLTIPAGSTTGTVTVTIVADGVAEPNEAVIVTLGTPSNATLATPSVHTLTIAGQTPTVSLTAATQTVNEGVGTATITAQLSQPSTQTVTVPFTVDGTAIDPDDYTISASPLTIPAGSTSGTVTVTVEADAVAEPSETVIVTLGTPGNATLASPSAHTLTIAAQVPTVSFTAATQTVGEGVGTATITAQLSQPSTQTVTVPFTVGGSATNPADYTISASPLTILAGSTSGTVTVTVVADGVAEPNETVIVTLGVPTNATLASPSVHTLTIGAQPLPTVNLTAASQTVGEGVGTTTITAQLSGPSSQVVTVPFVVGGSANDPADYTISASPITIPAGSTTGTITVTVIADGVAEPNETVVVTLGTPSNATLGAPSGHTLTISGQTPTVSLTAASQTVDEDAGTATITAELSEPSTQAVTVPFTVTGTATNPADYTISTSPLTIPAGSTSGTVTVTLVADGLGEPDETVIVTLGSPTNATLASPSVHTLTIDAQLSKVSFTAAARTVNEAIETVTITAQLSEPSSQTVTVPFTVAGTASNPDDYTISATPLSFTPGSTTRTITVTVENDFYAEPTKTVIVTLQPPTNATRLTPFVYTLTITDDDVHPPVLSNLSFTLVAPVSSGCDVFGGPLGAEYQYEFSYSDDGGDVFTPGARDSLYYHFNPSDAFGGFDQSSSSVYSGSGSSGIISNSVCFLFEEDASVDVSLFVTDYAGSLSAPITTTVPKPSGANFVAGSQSVGAIRRSAVRAGPR